MLLVAIAVISLYLLFWLTPEGMESSFSVWKTEMQVLQ